MISDWSGRERCVVLGEYLLEHSATVRVAAQVFGISKSTVHKDVTDYSLSLSQIARRKCRVLHSQPFG